MANPAFVEYALHLDFSTAGAQKFMGTGTGTGIFTLTNCHMYLLTKCINNIIKIFCQLFYFILFKKKASEKQDRNISGLHLFTVFPPIIQ